MNSPRKRVLFVSIVFSIIFIPLAFMLIQEKSCDEHVVLEDGTEYDCTRVLSYVNGMSTINTCEGERINVPTHRIKRVTKIKNR
jgi:hypothetical protein